MHLLTVKIPDELDAALQAASRSRGVSRSAVVQEALAQALGRQADQAATAERWVAQWRGRLPPPSAAGRPQAGAQPRDERLAGILAKHLR